jgi:hypothetical protein
LCRLNRQLIRGTSSGPRRPHMPMIGPSRHHKCGIARRAGAGTESKGWLEITAARTPMMQPERERSTGYGRTGRVLSPARVRVVGVTMRYKSRPRRGREPENRPSRFAESRTSTDPLVAATSTQFSPPDAVLPRHPLHSPSKSATRPPPRCGGTTGGAHQHLMRPRVPVNRRDRR